MKKFAVPVVFFLSFLLMVCTASGQSEESSKQKERLENEREKLKNISQEEKLKPKAGIAAPAVPSREDQLKTILVIEENVAKLKAATEGLNQGMKEFEKMPEENKAAFKAKMAQMSRDRLIAILVIDKQLEGLRPIRPGQQKAQAQPDAARLAELQNILKLAIKEKAVETAKRLEGFIAQYQRKQIELQVDGEKPAESKPQPIEERPRPPRPQRNP